MSSVSVFAVTNLPEIRPDDDLVALLVAADPALETGDILIVTQKVVSKSEGRLVRLDDVIPGPKALDMARHLDKHPGHVELVLQESQQLLRWEQGVMISRTREGFVCANAGIDLSNVDGGDTACLLPLDCDLSARRLSQGLSQELGFHLPVIISDSFGRPWRNGITNVALGSYGLEVLLDYRGETDSHGMEMKATVIAVADALAAATELVVGKTTGCGASVVRGYEYIESVESTIKGSLRPWDQCFFT
jgi:coenzyme F420-0:L-glutamate ligase / coenzyme F420-1:gamma-L-glutamate ligase